MGAVLSSCCGLRLARRRTKCDQRCPKCDTRCSGLLGHRCPPCLSCRDLRCPISLDDLRPGDRVYALEDCGCTYRVEELDAYVQAKNVPNASSITCPLCRTPIRSSKRYTSITGRFAAPRPAKEEPRAAPP